MSKISALATAFEQSAIERSRATDEAVRSALTEHENGLLQALSESERRTSDAIRASQSRQSKIAAGGWMMVALVLAGMLALSGAAAWWQGLTIAENRAEIAQQRETIGQQREQMGDAKFNRCGEERRWCVAIDQSAPAWGKNSEYRILEGY